MMLTANGKTHTSDAFRIAMESSLDGVEDRVAVYDAVSDQRKTLVMYQSGSHSMFTDRASSGGSQLNQQVKAATSELTLAFLQHTFDTDISALQRWSRSWHAIVARSAWASVKAAV